MEERGPPDTGADDINEEPAPALETQLVPYGPVPRPDDTYVIHFPKDQIYRVPPPENALIVEKHRKPVTKKKPRKSSCLAIVAILFVVFLITGITLLALYLTLSPKDPTFSITQVQVKKPKTKSSHPGYEISLKVVNPNDKMSVKCESGGGTSLLYRQKNIGKGKFPSLSLGDDESDVIKLDLTGTSAALPSEVQKSIQGTSSKTKTPLSLSLKISDLPVKIKYGIIKSWDKNAEVECKFKVDTLGSGTRVLEQDCEASFSWRWW